MTAILRAIGLAALAATASATQVLAAQQAGHRLSMVRGRGFVRSFEFEHKLRICNAYAFEQPLHIFQGEKKKLTGEEPLAYKDCRDFSSSLRTGDRVDFKAADATMGTFSISDLPASDAILLLVIYQHDPETASVSFKSHVFANTGTPQLAIIDVYKGKERAKAVIVDIAASRNVTVSEELRFDSVVAVNEGTYEIHLEGTDGTTKAKANLVALEKQSYAVLRTGVESEIGKSFPESLVVFPQHKPAQIHQSGACRRSLAVAAAVLSAIAMW
mmetsp:Transcript_90094/g.250723  ORF Transcript_90094/g.250723 Transcript_90094/m.250723 type:complete len:272 (+) Transcript_90094:65-880(+)